MCRKRGGPARGDFLGHEIIISRRGDVGSLNLRASLFCFIISGLCVKYVTYVKRFRRSVCTALRILCYFVFLCLQVQMKKISRRPHPMNVNCLFIEGIRRCGTKRSEIQVYFFAFFHLNSLFLGFFTFFRLIFVSLRFFHLNFAYFTFVFASDFWCFASK